jgi:5-methyltetrahydropteroyltriglutamate--homocysteine methyltransferase
MPVMSGPFDRLRIDHVGSLIRPASLTNAWERRDRGELDEAEFGPIAAEAVRDLVSQQRRRGITPVTDGEFWRRNFQDTFPTSVRGYAGRPMSFGRANAKPTTGLVSEASYARRLRVTERLELEHNHLLDEYRAVAIGGGDDVKVTLIGPERITQRCDLEASREVYPDREAFIMDVVRVEREMIGQVIEAGCRYVQIDEPSFTAYVDPRSLQEMRDRGEEPAASLKLAIEANNALVEGFDGVTFGIHLCRGNGAGVWHREGTYETIAEQVFGGLRFSRLLLEYDTDRAGTFEPLQFVSADAVAVLGLISTKVPELESADELLARIENAGRFIDPDRLALSPQCGFSSGVGPARALTIEQQWDKLALMGEVATRAWGPDVVPAPAGERIGG